MAKSVEAYLAKDFEETAAGYFASGRREIVDAVALFWRKGGGKGCLLFFLSWLLWRLM